MLSFRELPKLCLERSPGLAKAFRSSPNLPDNGFGTSRSSPNPFRNPSKRPEPSGIPQNLLGASWNPPEPSKGPSQSGPSSIHEAPELQGVPGLPEASRELPEVPEAEL